ncbi:MAG: ATP-binding cassette domain-containing protein, partial [Bradyrhizobium sp.]
MTAALQIDDVAVRFGGVQAVDGVSFHVEVGDFVGLIGPNGAGKTTALKAILGLAEFDGELSVLGLDPRTQRTQLMQQVCFIADVAVLPRWLRVGDAVDFVGGVHPHFSREKCLAFLARTKIKSTQCVRELSKGMIVQL